jgi:hypothetical protein
MTGLMQVFFITKEAQPHGSGWVCIVALWTQSGYRYPMAPVRRSTAEAAEQAARELFYAKPPKPEGKLIPFARRTA